MERQPKFHFQGIFVPAAIIKRMLIKKITTRDLLLLMVIRGLTEKPGKGCYASREFLASALDVTPSRISQQVAKLKESGLLIEYHKKNIRYYETRWDDLTEEGAFSELGKLTQNPSELGMLTPRVRNANSPIIDEEEEMKIHRFLPDQNGQATKVETQASPRELVPDFCFEWNDWAYRILRSRRPPLAMTKVTRQSGAESFHQLWKQWDKDTDRVARFLEGLENNIQKLKKPVPSSVRQLCNPNTVNWLEQQVVADQTQEDIRD